MSVGFARERFQRWWPVPRTLAASPIANAWMSIEEKPDMPAVLPPGESFRTFMLVPPTELEGVENLHPFVEAACALPVCPIAVAPLRRRAGRRAGDDRGLHGASAAGDEALRAGVQRRYNLDRPDASAADSERAVCGSFV
jgi:hypothetical protein